MVYDIEKFLTGEMYVCFESAEEAREFARQTEEYINAYRLDVRLGAFRMPQFVKSHMFKFDVRLHRIVYIDDNWYGYPDTLIPANQLILQDNFKKDAILAFLDES